MQRRLIGAGLVLGLALLQGAPAHALIIRLTPLSDFLDDSDYIFVARAQAVDPGRPSMVLKVEKQFKGKAPFAGLAILLKGDNIATKNKEVPQLLKRVAPNLPLVVFVTHRDKELLAFCYTNGTWFGVGGVEADGAVRWRLRHCEPYLRRTFKGTTAQMEQTVVGMLAGKRKSPPIDKKEKPGLGPELPAAKKGTRAPGGVGWVESSRPTTERHRRLVGLEDPTHPTADEARPPALGVIAAPPIAALLAMLAMLFPTVFGGWKRWLVLLTVLATNGTLYGLHYWFATSLVESWWGTPAALWTVMTLIVVLGSAWAWQRHLARVQADEAPPAPGKIEVVVLVLLSIGGLTALVVCHLLKVNLLTPDWLPLLAFCIAIWAGALYVLWAWLRAPRPALAPAPPPPPTGEGLVAGLRPPSLVTERRPASAMRGPRSAPALATEVVVLTALVLACTALGAALPVSRGGGLDQGAEVADRRDEDREVVSAPRLLWTFRLPEKGSIVAAPLVAGDRIIVAAAHDNVFRPYGTVYCLKRDTGEVVWKFNDGKRMKQIASSPCLADGKVYLGEGFHQDSNCRVFCLDVATGEKVWTFPTGSHTESSPVVVDGRVYFGAGDDGMYCVEAATGKKIWQFKGFHIDASPVVAAGRVYAGSGVGDTYKQTFLFCLDAANGKPIWRYASDLPVWGESVVVGDRVYFGTGNGRLNEDGDVPAGAVVCLRASDGEKVWAKKLPNAVLGRVSVDGRHVYFGCRDQHFYCFHRDNGAMAWKRRVGSSVVTAAPLARSGETTTSVYVTASGGQLFCLGPNTSKIYWALDVGGKTSVQPELISSPALEVMAGKDGEVRRLYVGMTLLGTARTGQLRCYEDRREPAVKE
jgi:outer membrane protein assembly factor BamB